MTQRTIIMSERGANEIHFMTTELTERAEKAEARIKELEGVIYAVLHSGDWYPSALEIDMHKTEGMCGESLEAMMKEVLEE